MEVSTQALIKSKGENGVRGGVRPRAHHFRRSFMSRLSSYECTMYNGFRVYLGKKEVVNNEHQPT
jgi:hypothetical protein